MHEKMASNLELSEVGEADLMIITIGWARIPGSSALFGELGKG